MGGAETSTTRNTKRDRKCHKPTWGNAHRRENILRIHRWTWGSVQLHSKPDKIAQKQPDTHGPTSFGPKQHEAISTMMLKYPHPPWEKREHTETIIQCDKCKEIFNTYKGRHRNQQKSTKCKIQNDHTGINHLCPNGEFHQLPNTQKQLEKNLTYRFHQSNTLKTPNELNLAKRTHQNKMTNLGAQMHQYAPKQKNNLQHGGTTMEM